MRALLAVIGVSLVGGFAVPNAHAAPCGPIGGTKSFDFESAQRPDGGSELTEYMPDGTYRISRCGPDRRLRRSQVVAALPSQTGVDLFPVMTYTADGPVGGRIIGVSYMADQDGRVVEASGPPPEPGTNADVLPPTEPRPLSAVTSRNPPARASQSDPGCSQGGYTFFGFPIYTGYYGYKARVSTMPRGDDDRVAITRGHHTWNNTVNPCGFPDVTNLRADYRGNTSVGVHGYRDGNNVVDFGDPGNVGCSGNGVVLACTITLSADGIWASDVDQRYNSSVAFYNGAGSVPGNRYDLWSVAAHESGHGVGVGHNGGNFLTMYPSISQGQTRVRDLGYGDAKGFRCRYGVTQGGC